MFHYSNHAYALDTPAGPVTDRTAQRGVVNYNSLFNRGSSTTRFHSSQINNQSTYSSGGTGTVALLQNRPTDPATGRLGLPAARNNNHAINSRPNSRFDSSYREDALNVNIDLGPSSVSAVQNRKLSFALEERKPVVLTEPQLPAVEEPSRRYLPRQLTSPFSINNRILPLNSKNLQMTNYSLTDDGLFVDRVNEERVRNVRECTVGAQYDEEHEQSQHNARSTSQVDFTAVSRLRTPVVDVSGGSGGQRLESNATSEDNNNCYSPRLEESNLSSYNLRHSDLSFRRQWERQRSTPINVDGRAQLRSSPGRQSYRQSIRDSYTQAVFSPLVSYTPAVPTPLSRPGSAFVDPVLDGLVRSPVVQLEASTPLKIRNKNLRTPAANDLDNKLDIVTNKHSSDDVTADRSLLRDLRRKSLSHEVCSGLFSGVFLTIVSLVMCILGLQLLLRLAVPRLGGAPTGVVGGEVTNSLFVNRESSVILRESAVAVAAVIVVLNLWCVWTNCLQCYLVAKLVSDGQTNER